MEPSPISYAEIERQIQQQAYAVVPFAVSRAEFDQAINVFVRFLSLPLETKEKIYFKLRPNDRGTEVGYKRYLRNEGQTDNREYVHYHRTAEEGFREMRQEIPELDELLETMKRIHDEAVITLQKIIGTFEDRFPGISDKFFSQTNSGDFYLRFLKYDLARPGEFLAKGHYDRGSCTLALAENAPGLRMGINDKHLNEVTHREGEALFMPGLKFPDLTSETFVPTWHDVIQKSEHAYSEDIARWAIVFFADPHGMENITYEEAHTPK